MSWPLVLLAVLSVAGGALIYYLPGFLEPVTTALAPHGAAAGAHGAGEAGGHGSSFHIGFSLASVAPTIAGILGIALSWAMHRNWERSLPAAWEKLLGLLQDLYEGFCHIVFVRAGDAIAGEL